MFSQALSDRTTTARPVQGKAASAVLDAVEDWQPLLPSQALPLLALQAPSDCARLRSVAEALKAQQAGGDIAYGTGHSLFLTNVCEMAPALYPYPATQGNPQAYRVSIDDLDATLQAVKTQQSQWLTVSGGGFDSELVIPGLEAATVLKTYLRVLNHIQDQVASCRIQGFSPDEIAFLAVVSNRSEAYILDCLKDHGVRVLESFGTEILEDAHRARIAPKKLTVKRWLEIVALAHHRGMPTIARLEAGPLESREQRVAHLALLREFQEAHPGAFQRLIIQLWPHPSHQPIAGPQAGLISESEALKLVSVARLLLGEKIPQIQFSWVPERLEMAQQAFEWGGSHAGYTDDLSYAQFLRNKRPAPVWTEFELRGLIEEAGQRPVLKV